MERNHGHWMRYGWSVTCSECGFITEGQPNYCRKCGSIMDGQEEWSVPTFNLPTLEWTTCLQCGNLLVVNSETHYCENCGAKLYES